VAWPACLLKWLAWLKAGCGWLPAGSALHENLWQSGVGKISRKINEITAKNIAGGWAATPPHHVALRSIFILSRSIVWRGGARRLGAPAALRRRAAILYRRGGLARRSTRDMASRFCSCKTSPAALPSRWQPRWHAWRLRNAS